MRHFKRVFKVVLVFFLLFISDSSFSQINEMWKSRINLSVSGPVSIFEYQIDKFGNVYHFYSVEQNPEDSLFLCKIDTNGNLIWNKLLTVNDPSLGFIYPAGKLMIGPSGLPVINFIIDSISTAIHNSIFMKCDTAGNVLWTNSIPAYSHYPTIDNLENIIGNYPNSTYDSMFFYKIDSTGLLVYNTKIAHASYSYTPVTNSQNETFYPFAFYDSLGSKNLKCYRLNQAGTLIDSIIISNSWYANAHIDSKDNLLIVYNFDYTDSTKTFIRKYDSSLNILWDTGPTTMGIISYFEVDNLGNIYTLGIYDSQTSLYNEARVGKFDSLGVLKWVSRFGLSQNGLPMHLCSSLLVENSNNVLILGEYDKNGNISSITNRFFIKRLNPNGILLDYEEILKNGSYIFEKAKTSNNTLNVIVDSDIYKFCMDCAPTLSGNVFLDGNSNCAIDISEKGLKDAIVEVVPGILYLNTDSNGYYHSFLSNGNYDITLGNFLNITNTCANDTVGINISNGNPALAVNFGKYIDPTIHDLSINAGNNFFRPGFNSIISIRYKNNSGNAENGIVDFIPDSLFNFISASIPPTLLSGDTLRWTFTNLLPGESGDIYISLNVPSSTPINTPLTNKYFIGGNFPDFTPNDNMLILNDVIQGSYDPNTKSVYPLGTGTTGNITSQDSILHYTINFENIGNDTAFTVLIIDTLDNDLDISSLVIETASHPYSWKLIHSNILNFRFNSINLSAISDPNSNKGFIKYSIKQKRGLLPGTEITNAADIYFDYNYPIKTNRTFNTRISLTGIQNNDAADNILVYPNPATDEITISNIKVEDVKQILLFDVQGRVQTVEVGKRTGKIILNISNLKQGIYVTHIFTTRGIITKKVVKL